MTLLQSFECGEQVEASSRSEQGCSLLHRFEGNGEGGSGNRKTDGIATFAGRENQASAGKGFGDAPGGAVKGGKAAEQVADEDALLTQAVAAGGVVGGGVQCLG